MEGYSGIFEHNFTAMRHGSELWSNYERECMTSDVLAVCEAANEFGINEILIYDGHYAGNPESNIIVEDFLQMLSYLILKIDAFTGEEQEGKHI